MPTWSKYFVLSLFRNESNLTEKDNRNIKDLYIFNVENYVSAGFTATFPYKASYQNHKFAKSLINY